jgi:hypothetical protein
MMRTALSAVGVAMLLLLTACPKSRGKGGPDASASASASARSSAGIAAQPASAAAPASAAPSPPGAASTYAGTYTLAPATYHIAEGKDYAHVKQAKDEPSKLVGNGSLKLSVDPQGRVTGEIDSGPASPAVIDGTLINGEIRGNVRRKTPSDDGLTGTIVAKVDGTNVSGKLVLAEANAAIVRDGPVTLTRK